MSRVEYRYFSNIGTTVQRRRPFGVRAKNFAAPTVSITPAGEQVLKQRAASGGFQPIVMGLDKFHNVYMKRQPKDILGIGLATAYQYAYNKLQAAARLQDAKSRTAVLFSIYAFVRSWTSTVISLVVAKHKIAKPEDTTPIGKVIADMLKSAQLVKIFGADLNTKLAPIAAGFNAFQQGKDAANFAKAYRVMSDIITALASGVVRLAAEDLAAEGKISQQVLTEMQQSKVFSLIATKIAANMSKYFSKYGRSFFSDEEQLPAPDELDIEGVDENEADEEGFEAEGETAEYSRLGLRAKLYSVATRWLSEHAEADEEAVEEAVEQTAEEIEAQAEAYEEEQGEAPSAEEVEKAAVESLKARLSQLSAHSSKSSFSAFLSRKRNRTRKSRRK